MPAKKTAKKSSEEAAVNPPVVKKAAKKTAAKAAVKTAATPVKSHSATSPSKVTPDMIARAAYLNYRRRIEQGLPGDRESDWLEAERQLCQ